jgi:hypothetical protein
MRDSEGEHHVTHARRGCRPHRGSGDVRTLVLNHFVPADDDCSRRKCGSMLSDNVSGKHRR